MPKWYEGRWLTNCTYDRIEEAKANLETVFVVGPPRGTRLINGVELGRRGLVGIYECVKEKTEGATGRDPEQNG